MKKREGKFADNSSQGHDLPHLSQPEQLDKEVSYESNRSEWLQLRSTCRSSFDIKVRDEGLAKGTGEPYATFFIMYPLLSCFPRISEETEKVEIFSL